MGFWKWFRDSQRPQRPNKRASQFPFPSRTRSREAEPTFHPGRSTKIAQVVHAVPADNYGMWGLDTSSGDPVTIRSTYGDLVRLLGAPNGRTGGDATTSEWVLLHDGGRFTIYVSPGGRRDDRGPHGRASVRQRHGSC